MRKVLFKKWNQVDSGKGQYGWSGFVYEGLFHHWGSSFEEDDKGIYPYTVALVEEPDGKIADVLPSNIKFVTPYEKEVCVSINLDGKQITEAVTKINQSQESR